MSILKKYQVFLSALFLALALALPGCSKRAVLMTSTH